jgi:hypothetical protein
MVSGNRKSRLSREISRIFSQYSSSPRGNSQRFKTTSAVRQSLVCSSLALLALNPGHLHAVTLGEIELRSALGEPLNAVIPIQLGRGEMLTPNCITIPQQTSDLKGLRDPSVKMPNAGQPGVYELTIRTMAPLIEPVYELALKVNCPGTPQLVRQYVLMPDLPGLALPSRPLTKVTDRAALPTASALAPKFIDQPQNEKIVPRNLKATGHRIPAGSVYRVREGDSLSAIANRIKDRPLNSTWKLASIILRKNPSAFIGGNADLIKLGAEIRIPDAADWSLAVAPLSRSSASRESSRKNSASTPTTPVTAVRAERNALAAENKTETEQRSKRVAPDMANVPASIANVVAVYGKLDKKTVQFLDQTTAPRTESRPAAVTPTPMQGIVQNKPVIVKSAPPRASAGRGVNPFTAIGVGILLGLAVSMLLLRTRFTRILMRIIGRSPSKDSPTNKTFFDSTDSMFATNAIATGTMEVPMGTEKLQVKHTQAQDYIVEASEPSESTLKDEAVQSHGVAADGSSSEDTLLEILFTENEDLDITQDTPVAAPEIFLDGGEKDSDILADDLTGPTREMPPAKQTGTAIEPTAEMPAAIGDETALSAAIDALPDDLTNPPTRAMSEVDTEAQTAEVDLAKLAEAADNDDALSATLMEALTLLEKDYEEEMTASQVIDRKVLEKRLEEESELDIDASVQARKVTG